MAKSGSRLGMMLVIFGLLAMVQHSTQLSVRNPLRNFIDRINLQNSGFLGLVLSSDNNEKALNESNAFLASSSTPYVDVAGRRFHIGKIGSVDVVYCVAGSEPVNTALSAQVLINTFTIKGIIYVGTSGGLNSTVAVGDVVVPDKVADTGAWTLQEYTETSQTLTKGAKLTIGDYNLPTPGKNSLGSIEFDAIKVPTPTGTKTMFWLPLDSSWLKIAKALQSSVKCSGGSNSNCLSNSSNVFFGLRGVSSSIYVKNTAYGKYLNTQFKASIVDEGTTPVAVAAKSNGQKLIIIRGVSNIVGGPKSSSTASYSASVNAVSFALKFIEALNAATEEGYYQY